MNGGILGTPTHTVGVSRLLSSRVISVYMYEFVFCLPLSGFCHVDKSVSASFWTRLSATFNLDRKQKSCFCLKK